MSIRGIMHYQKDDILRQKAAPVERMDDSIPALLDDMLETLYYYGGVGLAAPQVGVLKRVIVIDIGNGVKKLINPEIIQAAGVLQKPEGCLGVPEVYGEVKRPAKVTVRALNEKGKMVRFNARGLLARVLSHEIDHLDGVLFIDKIVPGTFKLLTD